MGRRCALKSCINSHTNNPSTVVHLFPNVNDGNRRDTWTKFAREDGFVGSPNNFGICSLHFVEEDFWSKNSSHKRKLHTFAIPTIKKFRNFENVVEEEETSVEVCLQREITSEGDKASSDENNFINHICKLEEEVARLRKIISRKNYLIRQLQTKVVEMSGELKTCKASLQAQDNQTSHLKQMFTPGQLRLMESEQKQIKWKDEDMTRIISLYSVSSRCYNYLKTVCSFPLPTERTIRYWLSKVQLKAGLLEPVMILLSAKFSCATDMEKKCILGFDEMSIDEKYCYDPHEDRIFGGQKNVMVFAIRGLFSKWKQIVYYSYDGQITKEKLFQVMEAVHATGLDVVGVVHDMSTKNVGLWRALGTCQFNKELVLNSSSFTNPITGKNTYIFPDFPHLLKLLRNHFIDNGFTLSDQKTKLDTKIIRDLLNIQRDELKLTFKVTKRHINVRKKERQNVRPAFQLFSHSVSKAIQFMFPSKVKESNFLKLVNDFSDLMNVRVKEDFKNPYKCAYGKQLIAQNKLIEQMSGELTKMRVGKRVKSFSPFQKGMLISLTSLKNLYTDMQKEIGCSYLQTSHINQDYIENLFSRLRGIGGFNLNPTATEVKSRLKKLIFSWNFLSPHNSPTEGNDEGVSCLSATMLSALMSTPNVKNSTPLINESIEERILEIIPEVAVHSISLDDLNLNQKAYEGAQEYIAGYIAKKMIIEYPDLSATAFERSDPLWVDFLRNDKLTEPTSYWFCVFKKFEEWFSAYHIGGVNLSENVVGNLINLLTINYPTVPRKAIAMFVKTRTLIKIKHLNKDLAASKCFSHQPEQRIEDDESEFYLNHDNTSPEIDELEEFISFYSDLEWH